MLSNVEPPLPPESKISISPPLYFIANTFVVPAGVCQSGSRFIAFSTLNDCLDDADDLSISSVA